MADRLWFTEDGQDIIHGIELRNSRANGFGWETHEVWLVKPEQYPGAVDERKIGDIYCGEPINMVPGFGWRMESGGDG